jgi:hypothetical protein
MKRLDLNIINRKVTLQDSCERWRKARTSHARSITEVIAGNNSQFRKGERLPFLLGLNTGWLTTWFD